MSEQAQVGDTVRLTMAFTRLGKVCVDGEIGLHVDGYRLEGSDRTYEILSRASLPSEPGTWWLDKSDDVWRVQSGGRLLCIASLGADPSVYAPFRQLVLK